MKKFLFLFLGLFFIFFIEASSNINPRFTFASGKLNTTINSDTTVTSTCKGTNCINQGANQEETRILTEGS